MGRVQGRITKNDIKLAGLRRWDGKARVTTDWVNLFQEPELYFADGNCLVYLREAGKSGQGPAFRIHTSRLKARGFGWLTRQCLRARPLPPSTKCVMSSCPGCARHPALRELYLPAPDARHLEQLLDFHTTTRNFFAWLYDIPLTGRALGSSLVLLENRIALYGGCDADQSRVEVINYAESQGYLDFRECLDHALAALFVAENFQLQDLFIDALAHSAGLSHQGLTDNNDYFALSSASKSMIDQALLEMDHKIDRVSHSAANFFENDLSRAFLRLDKASKDHLDHFRSFLHSVYIEQYGFWPPEHFDNGQTQRATYTSMYADFRNLYLHLLDESCSDTSEKVAMTTGGICVLQNLQALDSTNNFEPLAMRFPRLPDITQVDSRSLFPKQRRSSWLSLPNRKAEREARNAIAIQALIDASNRDLKIMDNLLVRRYNEFEARAAIDGSNTLTLEDGRKVRWILIYAILQTLISVMQAPKQARNTEGLSYYLCCNTPSEMPWHSGLQIAKHSSSEIGMIEPDMVYTHTSNSTSEPSSMTRQATKNTRGQPLKPNTSSTSLRRMLTRKSSVKTTDPPSCRSSFCEIYVPGYGNGLNKVEIHTAGMVDALETEQNQEPTSPEAESSADGMDEESTPSLSSSTSVSRESSNASSKSMTGIGSDEPATPTTPIIDRFHPLDEVCNTLTSTKRHEVIQASDGKLSRTMNDDQNTMPTVHFNALTWDAFLQ